MLSYLVFGVLCTLLNIVLYALFNKLFGYTAANSWGNVLDNILCILFAYCTNRAFVFRSKTQGKAMAREFGAFVTCRLGTMVLDTAIMLVLGNLLAAQGAALMDELMQGVLSVVAHWLGPDTAIQMAASYAGTPAGVTDGSAAIAVIGGADGPTAIFVTSCYNAQALWGLAVKVFSNVLVIVLNYVFSKLIILKKVRYFLCPDGENIQYNLGGTVLWLPWSERFAFLVSGLVLGIIGATVSATWSIALSAVGMAKVRRASSKKGETNMTREEILSMSITPC